VADDTNELSRSRKDNTQPVTASAASLEQEMKHTLSKWARAFVATVLATLDCFSIASGQLSGRQTVPLSLRLSVLTPITTEGDSVKLRIEMKNDSGESIVVARSLVGTPAYQRSYRARYKIEALFAELKQRMRLERVRLRRLWNVAEQFQLAATAQNIKRLVRFLMQRPPTPQAKMC
jgi:Transposase DDE domain